MRDFVLDSIAWEKDPLFGWCNKNTKRNGEHYDVNTDGLRIFTTIDTRMQHYAEQAVRKHVGGYLQKEFNIANRYKKKRSVLVKYLLKHYKSHSQFALVARV